MPRTFGDVPTISQNEKKSEMLKKYNDVVKNFEKEHGEKIELKDFARYEVGEGI